MSVISVLLCPFNYISIHLVATMRVRIEAELWFAHTAHIEYLERRVRDVSTNFN